jgi:glycosyltransferase involved in cell wall biosynthesis
MSRLIIFTASFPFGVKETYLEEEVKILSENFDEIIIYPHYYGNKDTTQRNVPENVKVKKPALALLKYNRLIQAFIGLFKIAKTEIFIKEFFNKKVFLSFDHSIRWFLCFIDYLSTVGSSSFNEVIKFNHEILYFYWGAGWASSILNLKSKSNNKIFLRLHGGEVFLERSNGYIPIRNQLFKKVDIFLPISKILSEYLNKIYLIPEKKLKICYLGVRKNNYLNRLNYSEKIIIVSCSNVIGLKRLDLLISALAKIKETQITWVHFGDGPLLKNIINLSEIKLSKNIKFNFKGSVPNNKILEFYKYQNIDAFVNLSKHEGLPVSIMEAMSFGIPAIATNAGATRELVNKNNGMLLDIKFDMKELIDVILRLKNKEWKSKRTYAKNTTDQFFNAKTNYIKLGNILKK